MSKVRRIVKKKPDNLINAGHGVKFNPASVPDGAEEQQVFLTPPSDLVQDTGMEGAENPWDDVQTPVVKEPSADVAADPGDPQAQAQEQVKDGVVTNPGGTAPSTEFIKDFHDKLVFAHRKRELQAQGWQDATKVECPLGSDGKPLFVFRLCSELHRRHAGGLRDWQPLTHDLMNKLGIKLPNHPISRDAKKADDKVYLFNSFVCFMPNEVARTIRSKNRERSQKLCESRNGEKLLAVLENELGHNTFCKFMDLVKMR
jgi:hypothetical protein